ncbi:hypothetical protein CBF45_16895 [Bordetella sp. J329]|nr:hypothetical protein CBF45_16895 [Bordetella sp. J329]
MSQFKELLESVFAEIRFVDSNGGTKTSYIVSAKWADLIDQIIENLKSRGYHAERDSTDQNKIIISWGHLPKPSQD